ncbi:mCG1036701, partial [Mus musculus]
PILIGATSIPFSEWTLPGHNYFIKVLPPDHTIMLMTKVQHEFCQDKQNVHSGSPPHLTICRHNSGDEGYQLL